MPKYLIQAYYSVPFEASTYAPMSVRGLKVPRHLRSMEVEEKDRNHILAMVRKRLCAGTFEEPLLRLILIVERRDEFLMDSEGRVRYRGQNYYVTPGNLLRLRNMVLVMPFEN